MAINNLGNLTITNSNLNNNTGTWDGRVIYNNRTLTITNSTLTQNTKRIISNKANSTLTNNILINNIGNYVIFNNYNMNMTLKNNFFAYNKGGDRGIINNDGNINITNNSFIHNTGDDTGPIFSSGNINFTNNTIENNNITNVISGYSQPLYIFNVDRKMENNVFNKNTPAEFIIENNKIKQNITNNTITVDKFTLIIDDGKYYGTGTDELATFSIPSNAKNVKLIINGTDSKGGVNNVFVLKSSERNEFVAEYTDLVRTINDAITNEYESYVINLLPGDYTVTESINWENSATRNIIINGNGNIINGNNKYSFIKIAANHNLTLNNISITNCKNQNVGAIVNNGTLTITNSTLNNNTGSGYVEYGLHKGGIGGAIYNNGTLTITNSNLNNNQAREGGAIYNNGTLTITNSNLNNNNATENGGGGAIYGYYVNLTITNSNLNNNNAEIGGAI